MTNFDISVIASVDGVISLLVLIVLEIVLGIDNIIFIAIITGLLPVKDQKLARVTGLSLALIIRIILLFGASWLVHLTEPIYTLGQFQISWRDVIMIAGGLFLIIKTIIEILHKFKSSDDKNYKERKLTVTQAILQIALIDIVFSVDSILTAVAVSKYVEIMIIAVVISMMVMLWFAKYVSDFINKYPTIKMLALCFLILIGLIMVIDGLHLHSEDVDLKGYAYVAMAFSLIVELLNIRLRNVLLKNKK